MELAADCRPLTRRDVRHYLLPLALNALAVSGLALFWVGVIRLIVFLCP